MVHVPVKEVALQGGNNVAMGESPQWEFMDDLFHKTVGPLKKHGPNADGIYSIYLLLDKLSIDRTSEFRLGKDSGEFIHQKG